MDEKQDQEFLNAMVEMRRQYSFLYDVMHDESADFEERWEASELVKGGFYAFIGRMQQIANVNGEDD